MKAGIVALPLDEVLKVARSVEGLKVEQQKGFYKITGTVPGRAVYPQFARNINEVHFSGFAQDPKTKIPGLIANPKWPKPTRRVSHFLDQREGLTREQIMESFRRLISSMVAGEQSEPVEFLHQQEPIAAAASAPITPVETAESPAEPVDETEQMRDPDEEERRIDEMLERM